MRANIIISLLWLMISKLPAQNDINIWYKDCTNCATDDEDSGKNYVYSASQKFQVEDINHNFDRRNTGSSGATTWHRGWDINLSGTADKGDIIVSNVTGNSNVLDIDVLYNDGKSSLVILTVGADNNSNNAFCYLHGWRNNVTPQYGVRSGDLVLFDPNKNKTYCILDTKSNKAWCEKTYNGDPFEFEGEQYETNDITFTRQYGDPIYPVGTSGAGDDNFHTHVEVISPASITGAYWNGLNARSPSVLLNINSSQKGLGNVVQQNPNIGVFNYNDIELPGDIIKYPGNKPTSIATKIYIDGQNAIGKTGHPYTKVAIVDQVRFLVSPKTDKTLDKIIAGQSLQGEISIGSNKTRYPESIKDNIGSHYSGNTDGVTGMQSFAYNNSTGAHPWDDYYFSDFATRKFKNLSGVNIADFSNDAQYPDGEYKLAVCAYEAGDTKNYHCSEVYPFSIDNFLPYIQTVQVEAFSFLKSKKIYWRNWLEKDPGYSHMVANDGYLESSGVFNGTNYEYPSYYKVTAEASESLEQLTCKINGLVSYGVAANTEKTKWVCDLLGLILQDGNEYTLHFEGKDKAGNSLIKTHALATQATGQKIINPVRINTNGSNQWSPASNAITGFDEYHKLKITKGCGKFFKGQNEERGADCFAAAFEYLLSYCKIPGHTLISYFV